MIVFRIVFIISLTGLLTLPLLTSYGWLSFQQFEVRHEMKSLIMSGLDDDELILMKFSQVETQLELAWEHSREFEYRGEMYDVVRTDSIGDSMYYWCIWDVEESTVKKKIRDLIMIALGQNQTDSNTRDYVIQLLRNLFLQQILSFEIINREIPDSYMIKPTLAFSSRYLIPGVPPPRITFFK